MRQRENNRNILQIGKANDRDFVIASKLFFFLIIRNFTAPQTIRIESGISHVMEQYDRSFKVQQLMGADAKQFNPSEAKKNMSSMPPVKKGVSFKVGMNK
jgi:hypothetical protein